MFKKLFLPACLLVATASHGSAALQQWLEANNATAQYENLSEEKKAELTRTIESFEKLFGKVQEDVAVLVEQNKEGVEAIKELLAVKSLNFSMAFTAADDEAVTKDAQLPVEEEQKEEAAA